jgi:penicillin-binding protein 2
LPKENGDGTSHDHLPPSPGSAPQRPRRARSRPGSQALSDFVSQPGARSRAEPRRLGVRPVSVVAGNFHGSAGFYVRVAIIGLAALGLFGLLALRLWSLEVLQGPRFVLAAQQQTYRLVDVPAPRGEVVDAAGRLLAGTNGGLAVSVDSAVLGLIDAHGRWWPTHQGRALLRELGSLSGVSPRVFISQIRHSEFKSPYSSAIVLPRISKELGFFLDEHGRQFPGIRVVALPERSYPDGGLGSEFLGLLGEVSPSQLASHAYHGVRAGEVVGQSGAEAAYDRLLNGGLAKARVVVDAQGRPIGPARVVRVPRPASGLQLTIDLRLQRVAEKAVADGIALAHAHGHYDARAGAAVVMNPQDGSVYALASYPSFDQASAATNPAYMRALLTPNDPRRLLVNRATQGLYPTGSTFKPIVAEAALASGLITPYSTLACTSTYTVGNHVFKNVESGINASLNLPQALSISCDTWFYRLGAMFYGRQQQGHLDMQEWAWRLGVGHPTGFDVPGEASGLVPTPAWLQRTFTQPWARIWYEGYSVNLAVGQGQLAITPLQLATAYSTLANGGTVVTPHIGHAVLDESGQIVRALHFPAKRHLRLYDVGAIRAGLYAGAHSGTSAAVFGNFPIPVAGKTGTAQAPPGSDHSWYASWAPADNPKLVVVVVIEHGGFGVEAAAPAAKEIYSAYFGVGTKRTR